MRYLLNYLLLAILIVTYFIPTLIVIQRKKDKRDIIKIAVLNLLLGWSGIGWIIVLILAVRSR